MTEADLARSKIALGYRIMSAALLGGDSATVELSERDAAPRDGGLQPLGLVCDLCDWLLRLGYRSHVHSFARSPTLVVELWR
jgi:hypothetical protein